MALSSDILSDAFSITIDVKLLRRVDVYQGRIVGCEYLVPLTVG